MSSCTFPSGAALRGFFFFPPWKAPLAYPPLAQPFACLQTGFLWVAVAYKATFPSTKFHRFASLTVWSTHSPPCCTSLLSIRGSRPRGNCFPLLRLPLTREPTRTLSVDPGAQGYTPTFAHTGRPLRSLGHLRTCHDQGLHGWPMFHLSMAAGFFVPRRCCFVPTALRCLRLPFLWAVCTWVPYVLVPVACFT